MINFLSWRNSAFGNGLRWMWDGVFTSFLLAGRLQFGSKLTPMWSHLYLIKRVLSPSRLPSVRPSFLHRYIIVGPRLPAELLLIPGWILFKSLRDFYQSVWMKFSPPLPLTVVPHSFPLWVSDLSASLHQSAVLSAFSAPSYVVSLSFPSRIDIGTSQIKCQFDTLEPMESIISRANSHRLDICLSHRHSLSPLKFAQLASLIGKSYWQASN